MSFFIFCAGALFAGGLQYFAAGEIGNGARLVVAALLLILAASWPRDPSPPYQSTPAPNATGGA